VCLFIPANLAFVDEEPLAITVIIILLDLVFLIDMIMCFFTSFSNEETMREVTEHKKIIWSYLKSWFIIDLLSILPINEIVEAA
jgi:potassium channel